MPASLERKDILIVDDEPDIGGLLIALFESEGYKTQLTTNLTDAKGAIKDAAINGMPHRLILLDLSLGKEDGRALIKDPIRKEFGIPIIVVSAYTRWLTPEDNKDITAVFEKPFDLDALSVTVDRVFRKSPPPEPFPRRSIS